MAAGAWVVGKIRAGGGEPVSLESVAPQGDGIRQNKPILVGEQRQADKPLASQPANPAHTVTHTFQIQNQPDIVYLTGPDLQQRQLVSPRPDEMARPVKMAFAGDDFYFLFRGRLYTVPLAELLEEQTALQPTDVMPPQLRLPSGERIREAVDLAAAPDGKSLYLLDKTNDVYRFERQNRSWTFAYRASPYKTQPDPHFIALEPWGPNLYLLDYARNQIWKKTGAQLTTYFPRDVPSWEIKPGDHDLTDAVDMHIDGNIYALTSQGHIKTYAGGRILRQPLAVLPPLPGAPEQRIAPRSLSGTGQALYITDASARRVIEIDKKSGKSLRQFVLLAQEPEFGRLHDAVVKDGKVFILAGDRLAWFPLASAGSDSKLERVQVTAHDWLGQLGLKSISAPVPGALLPDNFGLFPGARRLYRYGLHEGADFFDRHDPQGGGKFVKFGSPVAAIQAGTVIRADRQFREMTPAEYQQVLAQCQAAHETSRQNEDRFRGRQVWIEHPGGAVSVYAHLSAIPDGIAKGGQVKAGQIIGQVGNSGTSGGIRGERSNPHLHLEIWLHDIDDPVKGEYLGKWLGLAETKDLWEEALAKP